MYKNMQISLRKVFKIWMFPTLRKKRKVEYSDIDSRYTALNNFNLPNIIFYTFIAFLEGFRYSTAFYLEKKS